MSDKVMVFYDKNKDKYEIKKFFKEDGGKRNISFLGVDCEF